MLGQSVKRFIGHGVALMVLGSVSASAQTVSVSSPPSTVNVWDSVPVTATVVGSVDEVELCFLWAPTGLSSFGITNRLVMAGAGSTYTADIEGVPPGDVTYFAVARSGGVAVGVSGEEDYTVLPGASVSGNTARFTDVTATTAGGFGLWRQASGSFNPNPATTADEASCEVVGENGETTEWKIVHGRAAGGLVTTYTLFSETQAAEFGATLPVLQLYNYMGAEIISPPLINGAGVLFFTSKIYGNAQSATLRVDVSTVAEPTVGDWIQWGGKIEYTPSFPTQPVALAINDRNVKRIRIYRETGNTSGSGATLTTGAVVVDNIYISIPPTSIDIQAKALKPEDPSAIEPTVFSCVVENEADRFPAVNKKVTLWYKWFDAEQDPLLDTPPWYVAHPEGEDGDEDGWTWTNMVLKTGSNVFTGTWETEIPAFTFEEQDGYLYYFYRCDFDGVYDNHSPDGGATPAVSTRVSPVFCPSMGDVFGVVILEEPELPKVKLEFSPEEPFINEPVLFTATLLRFTNAVDSVVLHYDDGTTPGSLELFLADTDIYTNSLAIAKTGTVAVHAIATEMGGAFVKSADEAFTVMAPTVQVSASKPNPDIGEPVLITATLKGFAYLNVNGVVLSFNDGTNSGSLPMGLDGGVYTNTLTGVKDGMVNVTVEVDVVEDSAVYAGNGSFNVQKPTVSASHFPPYPVVNDRVDLEATLHGVAHLTVDSVTLAFYDVNMVQLGAPLTMTGSGAGPYSATLDPVPTEGIVNYQVTAQTKYGATLIVAQSIMQSFTPSFDATITVATAGSVYHTWDAVEVTATVIGFGSGSFPVDLYYTTGPAPLGDAGDFAFVNRIPMTGSNNTYTAVIEGAPAGYVSYYAVVKNTPVVSDVDSFEVTNGDSGNTVRFTDVTATTTGGFGLWRQASGSFNPNPATAADEASCEVTGEDGAPTEWKIIHGRAAGGIVTTYTLFNDIEVAEFGATLPILQIYNYIGSQIVSPRLAHGVGTFYFTSKIYGNRSFATLRVDVSYEAEPDEGDWVQWGNINDKINYTPSTPERAVALAINDWNVKRVRIYRETDQQVSGSSNPYTTGAVVVDNIMISMPSANVVISESLMNPGYPSALDPTFFRCAIANEKDRFPAVNRKVTLWYKWFTSDNAVRFPVDAPPMSGIMPVGEGGNVNGWVWTNMTLKSGSEVTTGVWEAEVPQQRAGCLYYFFRCDFDGYYYDRSPNGVAPIVTTKISPTYSPNLKTSLGNPYNEERVSKVLIRRFRSEVERVDVVDEDAGGGEYLLFVNDMELIEDYTWLGVLSMRNIAEDTEKVRAIHFTFQGINGYWDDAPEYDAGHWVWGQNDQPVPYPPLSDVALMNEGVINAEVANYDGLILFQFNTKTGEYTMKRGVYQNFDYWQASRNIFQNSRGLLGVQEEYANLEAWPVNYFQKSDTRWENFEDFGTDVLGIVEIPSEDTWTEQKWVYQNAEVLQERYMAQTDNNQFPGDNISKQNKAISVDGVLKGDFYMIAPFQNVTDGIETIELNARASIKDPFPILYHGDVSDIPGHNIVNYITYANVAEYSDADGAGFSIWVCWDTFQQPKTGYEIRIMQVDPGETYADTRMGAEVWRWKQNIAKQVGTRQLAAQNQSLNLSQADSIVASDVGNDSSFNARRYTVTLNYSNPAQPTIQVRFGETTGTGFDATFTDNLGSPLPLGGTFGFSSTDARVNFKGIKVIADTIPDPRGTAAIAGTSLILPNTPNANGIMNFATYATRFSFNETQWKTSSADRSLQCQVIPQRFSLYLGSAPYSVPQTEAPNFSKMTLFGTYDVSSLKWTAMPSIVVQKWDRQFVWFKRVTDPATPENTWHPVVLDEIVVNPWRAATRIEKVLPGESTFDAMLGGNHYSDWTNISQQNDWLNYTDQGRSGWAVLEGWVQNRPGSTVSQEVLFERSRANPNFTQGIVSPVMTDGLGSIFFDWEVRGGAGSTVTFAVEYSGTIANQWLPVMDDTGTNAVVVTGTSGEFASCYVPRNLVSVEARRFRVRVVDATGSNPRLALRNLVARGYPEVDETSWIAYNVLITDQLPSPPYNTTGVETDNILDDGVLYEGSSAVLNNATGPGKPGQPDDDAFTAGQIFDVSMPYIQTPRMDGRTGIGEIAFWYRNANPAPSGSAGRIVLMVAPSHDSPESAWHELEPSQLTGVNDLAMMAKLTNITNTEYEYFKILPYDRENFALRIYCYYNGSAPGRVVVDNVLVAEPMRPGFDILSVIPYVNPEERLITQGRYPGQPLIGQSIGFDVRIGRFVMAPEDIRIYVSYYRGTNTWGIANWLPKSSGWWLPGNMPVNVETVELFRVPDTVNQFSSTNGVPPIEVVANPWISGGVEDEVIQYVVWGDHAQLRGSEPIIQANDVTSRTFENPSWYWPVDLNARHGSPVKPQDGSRDSWSPYYFVYTCPPYSTLINEFYHARALGEVNKEYIEVIGPKGASIAGWHIDIQNTTNTNATPPYMLCEVKEGLNGRLRLSGEAPDVNPSEKGWGFYIWGRSLVAYRDENLPAVGVTPIIPEQGTLKFYRSNGALEQALSWGGLSYQNLSGYTHIGNRSVTTTTQTFMLYDDPNGTGEPALYLSDLVWATYPEASMTPGGINTDQTLVDIDEDSPISGMFNIFTIVVGNQGGSVDFPSRDVISGYTTTIKATAAAWWRIKTFNTDVYGLNEVVDGAAGEVEYPWTSPAIMTRNITNRVEFEQVEISGVPFNWLVGTSPFTAPVTDNEAPYPFTSGMVDCLQTSFLLDITGNDPWVNYSPELYIRAISVDADEVLITFRLANNASRVTKVNGVLTLEATNDLSEPDSWEPVGWYTGNLDAQLDGVLDVVYGGDYTWRMDRVENKMFYRVAVRYPEEP